MRSKVTLKELAKLLNVSVSTVSKALNDSPEISYKTIQRVKELAVLHNYRPNPTAVNLKSSKSGTIAVIIPSISNSFFAKVMSGIEEEAQNKGLQVITYISNESYEREVQIVDMVSAGFVDGVIIAPSEETQKLKQFTHFQDLIDFEIPVVLYDRINIDIPVDKVGVDDQESINEATRIFGKKGLTKIGLVSGIPNLDVGSLRIEGYKTAMEEMGLEQYIETSEDIAELRKKIRSMLEKGIKAVISTDIVSTRLITRIAYEMKLNIPRNLKVIGYVNEDVAAYLAPSVSYIDQHPWKMGQIALDFLYSRINPKTSGNPPVKEIVKTSLVHLESTDFR